MIADPDDEGRPEFVEVFEIGQCALCGKKFVTGGEQLMKEHYKDNVSPLFSDGDVIDIQVPYIKGPTICGMVYEGKIRIVSALIAGDYFYCQHRYKIEILDKTQERSFVDWLAISGLADKLEGLVPQFMKMSFDEFATAWENGEITVSDIPAEFLDVILTVEESAILFWRS